MPRIDRNLPGKTPWQLHVERWQEGCGGKICDNANHVCLGRGQVPCDVVFIGEAPGHGEDANGIPFAPGAPAGERLEYYIEESIGWLNNVLRNAGKTEYRWAITNLLGCIPYDEEEGSKTSEPDADDVDRCMPRLAEFMRIADPSLIVCVGRHAKSYHDTKYKHCVKYHKPLLLIDSTNEEQQRLPSSDVIRVVDIDHPAYVVRLNTVNQEMAMQRAINTIRDAILDIEPRGRKRSDALTQSTIEQYRRSVSEAPRNKKWQYRPASDPLVGDEDDIPF